MHILLIIKLVRRVVLVPHALITTKSTLKCLFTWYFLTVVECYWVSLNARLDRFWCLTILARNELASKFLSILLTIYWPLDLIVRKLLLYTNAEKYV